MKIPDGIEVGIKKAEDTFAEKFRNRFDNEEYNIEIFLTLDGFYVIELNSYFYEGLYPVRKDIFRFDSDTKNVKQYVEDCNGKN